MGNKKKVQIGQILDESFIGLNPREIKDNLDGIAYSKDEGMYTKNLTEAELEEVKSKFADIGLKLARLEEEKKEAMEKFKTLMKEPKKIKAELIDKLKFKAETKEGTLWGIDDQETGMMYLYDENAIMVDMRPLSRSERQLRLVPENTETGTND